MIFRVAACDRLTVWRTVGAEARKRVARFSSSMVMGVSVSCGLNLRRNLACLTSLRKVSSLCLPERRKEVRACFGVSWGRAERSG